MQIYSPCNYLELLVSTHACGAALSAMNVKIRSSPRIYTRNTSYALPRVVLRRAAVVGESYQTDPKCATITVRLCNLEDVPAVASICGQAFGSGNFPGIDNEAIIDLEKQYAVAVEKEVNLKLSEALTRKAEAHRRHREYRLRRQSQYMRAQLAAIRGERAIYPGLESPQDLRMVQNWLRIRMFSCIVAADAASGEILGCVSVSLMQAEAALPPPFPSSSPLRFYVSNMAMANKHRRRGGALELLRQCERIGRLWGFDSMWLHVSVLNTAAQALYQRAGFKLVNQGMPFAGPLRQLLMKKDLHPRPRAVRQAGGSSTVSLPLVSQLAADMQPSGCMDESGSGGPAPGLIEAMITSAAASQLAAESAGAQPPVSADLSSAMAKTVTAAGMGGVGGVGGTTREDGVFLWQAEVDGQHGGL